MTPIQAQQKAVAIMLQGIAHATYEEKNVVADFDQETMAMYDALAADEFAYWMDHKNQPNTTNETPF
jgi:hypothetical protein